MRSGKGNTANRLRGPVAVMVLAALGLLAVPAAGQECRGTKQWYAGECRYPDEVAALKREKARQEQARRRAEQARRQAEQERKAREDRSACDRAREADTLEAWQSYLDQFPRGSCRPQAESRVAELEAAVPPSPEQPPAAPPPSAPSGEPVAPVSAPSETAPPPEQDSSTTTPLAYVGFGLAAAGVVVGTITGIMSLSQASDLQDQCPNDVCSPELEDDVDTMMSLGHASTASFVIAGVGAVTGLVALLVDEPSEPEEGVARVQPLVGLGTLGVTGEF